METYLKISSIVIISSALSLILSNYRKDIAILLIIAVCCSLGILIVNHLRSVFDFLVQLKKLGQFDGTLYATLLKCVGIGLLGDITAAICNDTGYSSVGKISQILATVIILSLSTPIFERLLKLIGEIFLNI